MSGDPLMMTEYTEPKAPLPIIGVPYNCSTFTEIICSPKIKSAEPSGICKLEIKLLKIDFVKHDILLFLNRFARLVFHTNMKLGQSLLL